MTQIGVRLQVDPGLTRALDALMPPVLHTVFRNALVKTAFRVQTVAARDKIRPGGVVGKGKNRTILPPLPDKLTSRTGTLRRSIAVDRTELPFTISIGTELVYGRVHELGGTFSRRGGTATYPPRPFLRPALEDVAPEFQKYLEDELRSAAGL